MTATLPSHQTHVCLVLNALLHSFPCSAQLLFFHFTSSMLLICHNHMSHVSLPFQYHHMVASCLISLLSLGYAWGMPPPHAATYIDSALGVVNPVGGWTRLLSNLGLVLRSLLSFQHVLPPFTFSFVLVESLLSPRTSISTNWFSYADYVVPLTHCFYGILSRSIMTCPFL